MTVQRLLPNPLMYFVVEYSMLQNAVHRRSLRKVISNNRENLRSGTPLDFLPIAIVPSREEADRFIEEFGYTIAEQAQFEFRNRNWQHIADVVQRLSNKYSVAANGK